MNDTIGFSEVSTLAQCEEKWGAFYGRVEEGDDGEGLRRGTAFHEFLGYWWDGAFIWQPGGPAWTVWTPSVDLSRRMTVEEIEHVQWLASRFLAHYGTDPKASTGLNLVATELEGRIPSPVPGVDFTFHIDHVGEDDQGRLWVVEDKTYGSRQRLKLLQVSLQETLYVYGASMLLERPVHGVMFEGVYTQRWKPTYPTQAEMMERIAVELEGKRAITKKDLRLVAKDSIEVMKAAGEGIERPPAESFDRRWVDRSPEQIEQALKVVREVIMRRANLSHGDRIPIPNIGQHCGWCGARAECWGKLLGTDGEDYGFIAMDEDEEE